jgi:hypothetical protein
VDEQAFTASANAATLAALRGDEERVRRFVEESAREESPGQTRERLWVRWSLLAIAGNYDELLASCRQHVRDRAERDADTIQESLLLCVLRELTGDADRAAANLEVLERTFAAGPARRWLLPVSYLLGKASIEDLAGNAAAFRLLHEQGPSSLFYMLGQVIKRRARRPEARKLFRLAVEPFNYWPAILARRELGTLSAGMKRSMRPVGRPTRRPVRIGPRTPSASG